MTDEIYTDSAKSKIAECCKWSINDIIPTLSPYEEGELEWTELCTCLRCGSSFTVLLNAEYQEDLEFWETWPEDFEIIQIRR